MTFDIRTLTMEGVATLAGHRELDETRNVSPPEGCGFCAITDDEMPDACGGCIHAEDFAERLREGGHDLSGIPREVVERALWQAAARLTVCPGREAQDDYDVMTDLLRYEMSREER